MKVKKAEIVMAENEGEFQIFKGSTGSLANLYSHKIKNAKCMTETIKST